MNKSLILTLILTTSINLNAMNSCDIQDDQEALVTQLGQLSINPNRYPWSNEPSLKNQICFEYVKNMSNANDICEFATLADDLQDHIVAMYHIYNKTSKATLADVLEYGLLSEEFVTQSMGFYLDNVFDNVITTSNLQNNLDVLSAYPCLVKYSIQAHEQIFAYCTDLSQQEMLHHFTFLNQQSSEESAFKMALRLAYTKKYDLEIDDFNCFHFINNFRQYGVNSREILDLTKLLSPDNLPYTLPFLESAIGEPVTSLNFSQLTLMPVPTTIGNLVNLEWLGICGRKLTDPHTSIGNLVNLKSLYLHGCKLTNFFQSMKDLVWLKELYLSATSLTELPHTIGNLVNLTILDLSLNQLTDLPDEIGDLKNLKELHLNGNRFSDNALKKIRKLIPQDCKLFV